MEYNKIYKKIEKRYIIAGIILIILFAARQIIIQFQISHDKNISTIVNISGRQRMLSQKIIKDALMIYQYEDNNQVQHYIDDLEDSLDLFNKSHIHLVEGNKKNALKIKNSEKIRGLFLDLDPYFKDLIKFGNRVLNIVEDQNYNKELIVQEVKRINRKEEIFLEKMNEIVESYDYESNRKTMVIERTEFTLSFLIIVFIAFVTIFVLLPAKKTLSYAFKEIIDSNENIERLLKSMKGALFLVRKDGNILLMNSDAKNIIIPGLTEDKINNIKENIAWKNFDILDIIDKVRLGEKVDGLEVEIEDINGETITMILSGIIGKYNRKNAVLISAFDITAQKKAEKVLKEMAVRDELTGLYNRHFLESIIDSEIERSRRYEFPLSAAILDLDDFKQINDKWGHPVGDIILRETANILRVNLRESDYLVRIGGEEFIILMPHTDLKGAYAAAEKFRKAIESRPNPIVGKYTATFGVGQIDKHENYYKLYSRIDNALYKAKEMGKNCVIMSTIENDESSHTPLEWRESWNSGEKRIDLEHRNLFIMLSEFMGSSIKNKNKDNIIYSLDSIIKLIEEHFSYEERILEKVEYENLSRHKKIHKSLLEKAYRLKNNFIREEVSLRDVQESMFHDIIVGHILKEDINFFETIKNSCNSKEE